MIPALIILFILALSMNVACHNDSHIRESTIKTSSRRLAIVGQLMLAGWLIWGFFAGVREITPPLFFIFMLWGLSSIMSNVDAIARRWGREISELLQPRVHYERRKHPR